MFIAFIILFFVSVILFVLSYILDKRDTYNDLSSFLSFLGCLIGFFWLIMLINIPIGRAVDRSQMRDIRIFTITLNDQRKSDNSIENAAITAKMIEYNQSINEVRRCNTLWRSQLWTDPSVDTLKFIK